MSSQAFKLPRGEYIVFVDSDGCVFDTMELKHKECFAPNFIKHFGLQGVSRYARECWDYVNLYSRSRGCNRFLALSAALDLLARRREALAAGFTAKDTSALKAWTAAAAKLDNAALLEYIGKNGGSKLMLTAAQWSAAVNETIADIVGNGIPPFAFVASALKRLHARAVIVCCSATPNEALMREWREHGLSDYAALIAGQEYGTKTEIIRRALEAGFSKDRALMIGDAPGDYKAAKDNGIAFYPIVPAHETESWQRLNEQTADCFLRGEYGQELQAELLAGFLAALPEESGFDLI